MIRVGLNATCFDDRPSGANQRFAVLYGALVRRHPEIMFVVYEPSDRPVAAAFAGCANVEVRQTPLPSRGRIARLRAGLGYWRRALRADALDLFECFSLPLVVAPDCPTLLTVHDIRSVEPPGPWIARAVASAVHARAFAGADHVITVSETMRRRIEAFRPGTRVTTIHNAVPLACAIGALPESLPDAFMLSVGHLEARKNLSLLIDAVALLRAGGMERPLVIAGNDGGAKAALVDRIAARGVGDLVTIVEGADDATIAALYAAARLVVVPSRYEGFGIPLVEAMAAGRVLVTSDIAVFREIRGGGGLDFPVDDAAGAAKAIERGWSDDRLRAATIASGLERARDFAPDLLADQVAALYGRVLRP